MSVIIYSHHKSCHSKLIQYEFFTGTHEKSFLGMLFIPIEDKEDKSCQSSRLMCVHMKFYDLRLQNNYNVSLSTICESAPFLYVYTFHHVPYVEKSFINLHIIRLGHSVGLLPYKKVQECKIPKLTTYVLYK